METQDVTVPVLIAVTALPGAHFWRQNAGVYRTMDGHRTVKVTANGIADIMGCFRGRGVAIETKSKGGRLRETQRNFRAAWEKAGGLYLIARSPEEALAALAAL